MRGQEGPAAEHHAGADRRLLSWLGGGAASRFRKACVRAHRRTSCRLLLSVEPFGGLQASTHPVAQDIGRYNCSTFEECDGRFTSVSLGQAPPSVDPERLRSVDRKNYFGLSSKRRATRFGICRVTIGTPSGSFSARQAFGRDRRYWPSARLSSALRCVGT